MSTTDNEAPEQVTVFMRCTEHGRCGSDQASRAGSVHSSRELGLCVSDFTARRAIVTQVTQNASHDSRRYGTATPSLATERAPMAGLTCT